MGRKPRDSPSSGDCQLIFIGGATEVLDDALKGFIADWLVPTLVEEYIRLHKIDSMGLVGETVRKAPNELPPKSGVPQLFENNW